MTGDDVVRFLAEFEAAGFEIFVDGGWGVDALLGHQTRPHRDLDIALRHSDVDRLRALLEAKGFYDLPQDDTRDCNFVLGDDAGHLVDIHTFEFDGEGRNVYGCDYPLDSLTGNGTIEGLKVKCISPEWMVKFHTGYEVDEDDYRDVCALHERFGVPIPDVYAKFAR
jgi:lincosamide nucleotidyltransferase A/C/D/E